MKETREIVLPDLGEGIEQATVASWLCQAGECVQENQDIVEIVTDKASFCVPSPFRGKVLRFLAGEGQDVKIGEALAQLELM